MTCDNRNQQKRSRKKLIKIITRKSGRDSRGHISTRHRGGRHKRFLRIIDFKRNKKKIPGKVVAIEYDPNRGANLALVYYLDGDKRYIIAPDGLKIGQKIVTGEDASPKVGNALPLFKIPVGTWIHNVELVPGRGAQIARGAGTQAMILAKDEKYAQVKLPSQEIRLINLKCFATVGQVGNVERKSRKFKKAGDKRHLGRRPKVRGVVMHPADHPHGGGEGRSGIGMPSPKSPWGKRTLGKKTRKKKKLSNKYIIKRRK